MKFTRDIRIDNLRDLETRLYHVTFESGNVWGHKRLCDLSADQLSHIEHIVSDCTAAFYRAMAEIEQEESR